MKCSLLTASALAAATIGAHGQGYRNDTILAEFVQSPRMHEVLSFEALPETLDWRYQGGNNFMTVARNQHIPQYCGSCYAFASTSALSDRIRIARGAVGREVNLAMQVELNCDLTNHGCSGGYPMNVYAFIQKQGGIPDETCQPYEARGHDVGNKCNPGAICKKCDVFGCTPQENYAVYGVAEYGVVSGMFPIMAELQRGPVACLVATPPDFVNLKGWDIYEDKTGSQNIDHVISVLGYGTENGKDYWIIRNSWGTYWGYYGWARVARGKNNIAIETQCSWATPADGGRPKWRHVQEGIVERAVDVLSYLEGFASGAELKEAAKEDTPACRSATTDWSAVGGEKVTSARPHEEMSAEELPAKWDWRNVSGHSYVTWNTNEHSPKGGCASCWAHGVTSSLSDRIAVKQNGQWPQIGLSPQMLINCHGGGGCSGGDPAGAYAFIHNKGISDQTCQNYQAEELPCTGADVCMNCAPGGEHGLSWPGHCVAVRHPMLWFVSEYGSVRGAFPMKAEIYKRGPIGCGLDATSGFRSYASGIYSEQRDVPTLNQQVSLAGWGTAGAGELVPAGSEFWVGRNSWGTYWGEEGWFRIQMHRNNLGVETDCDWGVPYSGPPTATTSLDEVTVKQTGNLQALVVLSAVVSAATFSFVLARRRLVAQGAEDPSAQYLLIE